jgi:hypothetical protein
MLMILWYTMPLVQQTGTVIFTFTMQNLRSHKQCPSSKHEKTATVQLYKHQKAKI